MRTRSEAAAWVRRWAWLAVLTAGASLFELVRVAWQATQNPNLLPSLLLLGAICVPAAFVTFVHGWRLGFDVPVGVLAVIALAGGVTGVATAGLLEYETLRQLGTLPLLAVAVIEELAKLIGPVVVLLLYRHRSPSDGLLVGVASGAGFAVMETLGYAATALVNAHDTVSKVDDLLLQRGLLSPGTHMAWTGLTAAALWRAAGQRWSRRSVAGLAAALISTITLHFLWDVFPSDASYGLLGAASLAALGAAGHRLAGESGGTGSSTSPSADLGHHRGNVEAR